LCNDKEVVMKAVRQHGDMLPECEFQDWDSLPSLPRPDGGALGLASKELRNDKEVVLEAVKTNWPALEFASDELRADRDVVLAAVKQDGRALEYASDELKSELKKEANND